MGFQNTSGGFVCIDCFYYGHKDTFKRLERRVTSSDEITIVWPDAKYKMSLNHK